MTGPDQIVVATGEGGLGTDMVLNIGPQHPSTHGVLRLRLTLDGERVVTAEPIIGYMHRGAEKLFEVRDYRQILVLTNRHDWLSAFSNELGAAMAVERLMGIEVPERAIWLRTALAEINRMLNHLMFLGSYPLEIGAITPVFYAFRERETLQAVMEEISGGRMHYMFNRVGGLKEEAPAGWTSRARDALGIVEKRPARPRPPDPAQRHLPRAHQRRRRPHGRTGRGLRRVRACRQGLRAGLRPAPRRPISRVRLAQRAGRHSYVG
jgi:NADH-quinone oxidoreductase subunit D